MRWRRSSASLLRIPQWGSTPPCRPTCRVRHAPSRPGNGHHPKDMADCEAETGRPAVGHVAAQDHASVAQRWCNCFVNSRMQVQVLPLAPLLLLYPEKTTLRSLSPGPGPFQLRGGRRLRPGGSIRPDASRVVSGPCPDPQRPTPRYVKPRHPLSSFLSSPHAPAQRYAVDPCAPSFDCRRRRGPGNTPLPPHDATAPSRTAHWHPRRGRFFIPL